MSQTPKKIRAAVLREQPGKYTVEDLELSAPKTGEMLVEMVATGLCHSDDHIRSNDLPVPNLPIILGHEGAGIVREVGPGVKDFEVGDHIVTSFIPACGICKWCAQGMQNLCNYGALILAGTQLDGTNRITDAHGESVGTMSMLGTHANWQILDEASCVKIDKDVPLEVAALVGCGVPTGFGSAVNSANIRPGDVVIIFGAGGVGMNAVQGAAHAGASHVIVVDPVAEKREMVMNFGATEAFATAEEAGDLARALTDGQGADATIMTIGITEGGDAAAAYATIRKGGTLVVTGLGSVTATVEGVPIFDLAMMQKRIQGSIYGGWSPRVAIPRLLELYKQGQLKLDELITRKYKLEEINEAYEDMLSGTNIRGVIVHEH